METFSASPAICAGKRSPVNPAHKGQWRGALMLSLVGAWIYGLVNNRDAGDLRRHRAHYDVIVMNRTLVPEPDGRTIPRRQHRAGSGSVLAIGDTVLNIPVTGPKHRHIL